jgi:hypothetical protein
VVTKVLMNNQLITKASLSSITLPNLIIIGAMKCGTSSKFCQLELIVEHQILINNQSIVTKH